MLVVIMDRRGKFEICMSIFALLILIGSITISTFLLLGMSSLVWNVPGTPGDEKGGKPRRLMDTPEIFLLGTSRDKAAIKCEGRNVSLLAFVPCTSHFDCQTRNWCIRNPGKCLTEKENLYEHFKSLGNQLSWNFSAMPFSWATEVQNMAEKPADDVQKVYWSDNGHLKIPDTPGISSGMIECVDRKMEGRRQSYSDKKYFITDPNGKLTLVSKASTKQSLQLEILGKGERNYNLEPLIFKPNDRVQILCTGLKFFYPPEKIQVNAILGESNRVEIETEDHDLNNDGIWRVGNSDVVLSNPNLTAFECVAQLPKDAPFDLIRTFQSIKIQREEQE